MWKDKAWENENDVCIYMCTIMRAERHLGFVRDMGQNAAPDKIVGLVQKLSVCDRSLPLDCDNFQDLLLRDNVAKMVPPGLYINAGAKTQL